MESVRHTVWALVAALVFAVACLAVPALAVAEDAGMKTSLELEQPAQTQVYAMGGLQCALPVDYLVEVEGGVMYAQNAEETLLVALLASQPDEAVPADPTAWGDFFGSYAQAWASESDAVVVAGGFAQLGDGAAAYAFELEYVAGGVPVAVLQTYVPMQDGSFGLLQVAVVPEESLVAEADAIASSAALTTPEATLLKEDGVVLAQFVEVGGVRIGLPGGLSFDETAPAQEPRWYGAGGSFMVSVIPALVDSFSTIGTESLDLIAEGIAAGLDGTLATASVAQRGDDTMYLYTFAFSDGGVQFAGSLGLVPLADDTVTGVLTLALLDDNAAYAANAISAIFGSIELLEAE